MCTQNTPSLPVRTHIKAGGLTVNHGLKVRSQVQAGGLTVNHGLRVRA